MILVVHTSSDYEMGLEYKTCCVQVPSSHPLLNIDEVREEAGTAMGSILAFTASPIISR